MLHLFIQRALAPGDPPLLWAPNPKMAAPCPDPVPCSAPSCPYITPQGIPDHATITEHLRLHAQLAHSAAAVAPPSASTKVGQHTQPKVTPNMTERSFKFFVSEWGRYKRATGIADQMLLDELWSTMPQDIKQLVFDQVDDNDLNTEELMLSKIKSVVVVGRTQAPSKQEHLPVSKIKEKELENEYQYDSFTYDASEDATYDSFQYEASAPVNETLYEYENIETEKTVKSDSIKKDQPKGEIGEPNNVDEISSAVLDMMDSQPDSQPKRVVRGKHNICCSYLIIFSRKRKKAQTLEKVACCFLLLPLCFFPFGWSSGFCPSVCCVSTTFPQSIAFSFFCRSSEGKDLTEGEKQMFKVLMLL